MNMDLWLDELIKSPCKKAMPVLSFPSVSLMGITVKDLISDGETQARGMKMIADRVPSGASLSMMDLSVEAELFGSKIRFSDDEVPTVYGTIVSSKEEADALRIPKVGEGRTGQYIKAIEIAKKLITDRPVFAGVIGPFSLAGRLMDVTEALVNCYEEPEMVHALMEKTTAFIIDYINAYKKIGADGVVIAEPLTGLLSPDLATTFSEPYMKQIIDATQSEDFLVIYHNCGNNTVVMSESLVRTGARAFHLGNSISMKDMMPRLPADVAALGNVDPARQFKNGTPESIREETLRIMSECADYPNFVISSGCDVPPASSWENIDAFFAAVDEFNQSRGLCKDA